MENIEQEVKNLISEYEEYAQANGFQLNPNLQIVQGVVKGLLQRKETSGERYCPCRKMTNNKEEDQKIICPCVYHKDEISNDGHCHCNLFVRS